MLRDLLIGYNKRDFLFQIIGSLIWGVINALYSVYSINLTDVSFSGLPKYALQATIIVISWSIIEILLDVHAHIVRAKRETDFGVYWARKLYNIKPSVLKAKNTGHVNTLINKCCDVQSECIGELEQEVPLSIAYIVYFFVLLWKIQWILSIELVAVVILGNIFRYIIRDKLELSIEKKVADLEAQRNRFIYDSTVNINTLQKMRASEFADEQFEKNGKALLKEVVKEGWISEIGYMASKITGNMLMPIMILTYSLCTNENDYITGIILITAAGSRIVFSMRGFEKFITQFGKFKVRINLLKEITKDKNKRQGVFDKPIYSVELFDYKYSYTYMGEGKNNKKQITVTIPHFRADRGEKICIYGESGQGKTTLLNILSGEIETDSGKMLINGDVYNKRIQCTYIAQDIDILDLSLRDNLKLGLDVSDEVLIDYLNKVGMGDWFSSQENGLDTILGERGVFVSTGQRQRLNLIRGLLHKDSDIYLLDEPTSNVDEETEVALTNLIASELKDKTVIIVTHKLGIKSICNKVYKFIDGVCMEDV